MNHINPAVSNVFDEIFMKPAKTIIADRFIKNEAVNADCTGTCASGHCQVGIEKID